MVRLDSETKHLLFEKGEGYEFPSFLKKIWGNEIIPSMQKFIMKKSALSYCTIMVNMRSTLAEHGEDVAGKYMLLCLYCAEQVNGGVISDCGEWTSRQWMIRVGINDRPEDIPGIWHWENGCLFIDAYNIEGEAMALAKRQKGRDAANARWGNASSNAQEDAESNAHCNTQDGIHVATSHASSNASSIPSSITPCNTASNTKKRKEKERKEFSPSLPRDVEEVVSHLRNEIQRGRLVCPPDRLEHFAGLFLSDFGGRGWCDKFGIPVRNWKESARGFVARCSDNERGRASVSTKYDRNEGTANKGKASEYDI